MRLGIRSLNPLVWLLEAVGILPVPLMVGFWGMESSRALIAASELGLFAALSDGPPLRMRTSPQSSPLDETGTETLLNALSGFGYLRRRNGRYSLRRSARRWFARDARVNLTQSFGLFRVLWTEFDDLEERVRYGGARDFPRPERDAEFWRRYGMDSPRPPVSPHRRSCARCDSSDRRRGSSMPAAGTAHTPRRSADATRSSEATVLDLEPAIEVGRELIAEQGLSDRIVFRAASLTADAWGEGFDVVLFFDVLHVLSADDAAQAVRSAFDALVPGGTLAVVDSIRAEKNGDVDIVGGGSELLFYAINSTRAYPEAQMLTWIGEAGFEAVRARHLLAMPEVLITAVTDHGFIRVLSFGGHRQSSMYLDAPFDTDFEYPSYFHIALAVTPDATRALALGLGGGSVVKRMWRDYPGMRVDAVELDPDVVDVARRFFALPDDERIRTFVDDGRHFIESGSSVYDIVIVDVFDGDRIPPTLVAEEFLCALRSRLAQGGVVAYNFMGAVEGDEQ